MPHLLNTISQKHGKFKTLIQCNKTRVHNYKTEVIFKWLPKRLKNYLKTKIINIYKIPCSPSLRVYASSGPPVTSSAPG